MQQRDRDLRFPRYVFFIYITFRFLGECSQERMLLFCSTNGLLSSGLARFARSDEVFGNFGKPLVATDKGIVRSVLILDGEFSRAVISLGASAASAD